jgi:flavin-dependent dehydrogenase
MTPDVVIVGGGPAGLAAAIGWAKAGASTCLVERGTFPVDKPCGEGLLPNGVALLERLGVGPTELERVGRPIAGIRYLGRVGVSAEARFEHGRAVGLKRVDLSSLLLSCARRYERLEIVEGYAASLGTRPGGGVDVAFGGRRLSPRLVVIADGLGSRTARTIGIAFRAAAPKRWGARQHFAGEPWTDHVEVHFGDGFEAYVTPVQDGVNVAILWDQSRAAFDPGRPVIEVAVERLPRLAKRLMGWTVIDRAQAAGPFRQQPRERSRDGVVLIGDAAGYLDPLTGEGVGLALVQAALLVETVAPRLARVPVGRAISRAGLRPFLSAVDRATRSHRLLTLFLLRAAARPALAERIIAALDGDVRLFRHCLAANMGERALWRVPLQSLLRLPRVVRPIPG